MLHINIVKFIENFFDNLNNSKLKYCVLRNYEELPNAVEHDIDILMEKKELTCITSIIYNIVRNLDWQIVCIRNNNCFLTFIVYKNNNNEFLHLKLDIWTDFLWRGMPWIDVDVILLNLIKYKNYYYIPNAGSEAAVTALKEIMGGGVVPEKYYKKIKKLLYEGKNDFICCLSPIYGVFAYELYHACVNGNWEVVNNNAKKIKSEIFTYSIDNKYLLNYIRFLLNELIRRISMCFHKKGMMITIVGPDGSGKSSIVHMLAKEMKLIFPEQKIFHTRFNLFPEIRTGLGLTISKKNEINDEGKIKQSTKNNGMNENRSLISKLASWLVVVYYTLEFTAGRNIISSTKRRSGLVIFDRYYYDFFVQPITRDLIWNYRKLLLFFVPKPDVIIHLVADAEIVFKRKKELNANEISIQNRYFERILKDQNNYFKIQTGNSDIKKIVVHICYIIINKTKFSC